MAITCSKNNSENAKLRPPEDSDKMGVRATYREVGPTCPQDCKMLDTNDCYAMKGPTHFQAKKAGAEKTDGATILEYLLHLPPHQKIRHHVSGDAFMEDELDRRYLAGLFMGHLVRDDLRGWTYTHGWERFERPINLDSLTINASCDTPEEAARAYREGWPVTVVIEEPVDEIDGINVVVCPYETHGVTCAECMLCEKANRNSIIGFLKI